MNIEGLGLGAWAQVLRASKDLCIYSVLGGINIISSFFTEIQKTRQENE